MAEDGAAAPSTTDDRSGSDQQATNFRGILLMMAAMGAFCLNDTLTKTTAGELPTGEIIAIRGVFASLLMAPIVAMTAGLQTIPKIYSLPLLIRNISEIAAVILFLGALFRLPIANVTAILQTLPLTMTAAAAILFKEQVGWRRWSAAAVGLIGVLLIVRPGSVDFSWWYLSAIVAVVFITSRDVATRFIAKTTPSIVITFITAFVVMMAGCGLGLTENWVVPSYGAVVRLAAAAVLVLIGYYAMIECWRGSEISVIAPFRYSVVLWAMAFGYLFLGEVPDPWMIAGSSIVVVAGLYTFHRERRVKGG